MFHYHVYPRVPCACTHSLISLLVQAPVAPHVPSILKYRLRSQVGLCHGKKSDSGDLPCCSLIRMLIHPSIEGSGQALSEDFEAYASSLEDIGISIMDAFSAKSSAMATYAIDRDFSLFQVTVLETQSLVEWSVDLLFTARDEDCNILCRLCQWRILQVRFNVRSL